MTVILFLKRQVGLPISKAPFTLIPVALNAITASPKIRAEVAGIEIKPYTKLAGMEQEEMRTRVFAGMLTALKKKLKKGLSINSISKHFEK